MTLGQYLILIFISIFSSTNSESGYFWHITDFHLDVNYTVDGNSAAMCWPKGENPIKTANISGGSLAGVMGDYSCDSPYALVLSAMDAMIKFGPKPDFILWTGDDKAHVPDLYFSKEKVFQLVQNLTDTITKSFNNIPLVPVLGNHDWFPTHQLPPNVSSLYNDIGNLWAQWINVSTFREGGFYSKILKNGMEFVVLNTALYYNKNKQTDNSIDDPAGQFQWLEDKLKTAKNNGKKVYITSHVPPGVFERHMIKGGFKWFKPHYNKRFVDILSNYGDAIHGQFFAHHHTDSFRIVYNERGEPTTWLLIAPAVTPWNTTLSRVGPNNPALRKFYYDQHTKQITDFDQYYLNLTEANAKQDGNLWEIEYNAKVAYDLKGPITAKELNRVAQSFNTDNCTLFTRYFLYNSVSYQSPDECDESCKHYHYCSITNVDYARFEKCRNSGNRSIACMWLLVVVTVLFSFIFW